MTQNGAKDEIDLTKFHFVRPVETEGVSLSAQIDEALLYAKIRKVLKGDVLGDKGKLVIRFVDYDNGGIGLLVHEKFNRAEEKYDLRTACPKIMGRECRWCNMTEAQKQQAGIVTKTMYGFQVWAPDIDRPLGRSLLLLYAITVNDASPLGGIAKLKNQLIESAAKRGKPARSISEMYIMLEQEKEKKDRKIKTNFVSDPELYPAAIPEHVVKWGYDELVGMAVYDYSPELLGIAPAPAADPTFSIPDDANL